MKLIVKLSSTNPEDPVAEYAFIELSAERAGKLVQLASRVLAMLHGLDRDGLASESHYVSLGSDLAFFRGIRGSSDLVGLPGEEEDAASDWENQEYVILDESKGEITVRDDPDGVSLECFRADVAGGGISFAALPRHGDQTLLSREIPLKLLEQVARSTVEANKPAGAAEISSDGRRNG